MITRKDYMSVSLECRTEMHRKYYSELVIAGRIKVPDELLNAARMSKDEYFNDVRLSWWDSVALRETYNPCFIKALRDRGDCWSLGNAVCALKQAARMIIEAERHG